MSDPQCEVRFLSAARRGTGADTAYFIHAERWNGWPHPLVKGSFCQKRGQAWPPALR
jgi:hypothetical protein